MKCSYKRLQISILLYQPIQLTLSVDFDLVTRISEHVLFGMRSLLHLMERAITIEIGVPLAGWERCWASAPKSTVKLGSGGFVVSVDEKTLAACDKPDFPAIVGKANLIDLSLIADLRSR